MAYKITGMIDGAERSAKRRSLTSAAAKARDMRITGIRDVRVCDDQGREVPPDDWTRVQRERSHRRRVELLRNLGWGFFINPVVPFVLLGGLFAPGFVVDYWEVALFFGVVPVALGCYFLMKSRKIARSLPR